MHAFRSFPSFHLRFPIVSDHRRRWNVGPSGTHLNVPKFGWVSPGGALVRKEWSSGRGAFVLEHFVDTDSRGEANLWIVF